MMTFRGRETLGGICLPVNDCFRRMYEMDNMLERKFVKIIYLFNDTENGPSCNESPVNETLMNFC